MSPGSNDNGGSFMEALFSAIREGFRETKHDSEQPRDSSPVRWLKFLSIVIVLAVILGGVFALEAYVARYHGDSWFRRSEARELVREDDWDAFRNRFLVGACVGAGLGAIYVGRCLMRRVDP